MGTFQLTSSVDGENPTEHDLHLVNGQPVFLTGTDSIRQNVLTRLRFARGEWFLDAREGVPYFQQIFVKAPDLEILRAIFRDAILGTAGVRTLQSLTLDLSGTTRELTVNFVAVADSGELVEGAFSEPFIVGA